MTIYLMPSGSVIYKELAGNSGSSDSEFEGKYVDGSEYLELKFKSFSLKLYPSNCSQYFSTFQTYEELANGNKKYTKYVMKVASFDALKKYICWMKSRNLS